MRSFPRARSVHNENETEVTLRIRHDLERRRRKKINKKKDRGTRPHGEAVGNKSAVERNPGTFSLSRCRFNKAFSFRAVVTSSAPWERNRNLRDNLAALTRTTPSVPKSSMTFTFHRQSRENANIICCWRTRGYFWLKISLPSAVPFLSNAETQFLLTIPLLITRIALDFNIKPFQCFRIRDSQQISRFP